MLEVPRRSFLLGSLAALFSAPAIVRAQSLMKVRGDRFALQGDFLAPLAVDYTSEESLNYEYWAIGPMGLAKYTAREMLAAPAGVFTPWLPGLDEHGRGVGFRAVNEHQKGLVIAPDGAWASTDGRMGTKLSLYNLGDALDRDPVVRKLRGEQDALLRELREKRAEADAARRREVYEASLMRQQRAYFRASVHRTTFAEWEKSHDQLLRATPHRDTPAKVSPLAPAQ